MVNELRERYNNIFDELLKLENNWDSYGAEPISNISIKSANNFLEFYYDNIKDSGYEYDYTFIAPLNDGSIQIEFNDDNDFHNFSEIEFNIDNTINYIIFDKIDGELSTLLEENNLENNEKTYHKILYHILKPYNAFNTYDYSLDIITSL